MELNEEKATMKSNGNNTVYTSPLITGKEPDDKSDGHENGFPPVPTVPESKKSMEAKTTGIISYLSIVGWLIAYAAGDKEGAKFHLNQALILNAGWLLVSILSRFPRPIRYIAWIAEMILSVLWIIGFIAAIKNEERKVPLLGEIQILK